jgi:hypothetical protein
MRQPVKKNPETPPNPEESNKEIEKPVLDNTSTVEKPIEKPAEKPKPPVRKPRPAAGTATKAASGTTAAKPAAAKTPTPKATPPGRTTAAKTTTAKPAVPKVVQTAVKKPEETVKAPVKEVADIKEPKDSSTDGTGTKL